MTETQQRFLRAIAERVPMNQVVELHLFPPIRQGGVETGVAVVAEDPRPPAPNVEPTVADLVTPVIVAEPETPVIVEEVEAPVIVDEVETPVVVAEVEAEPVAEESASAGGDEYLVALAEDTSTVEPVAAEGHEPSGNSDITVEASDADDEDDESPYADDELNDDGAEEDEEGGDAPMAEQNDVPTPAPAAPVARYTIHTARYRLTLKGVDRGKWEVDVVAEADAPLAAVDAVVRGVQRRAGEGAEPDRLNAEAFRGALEAPLATLER